MMNFSTSLIRIRYAVGVLLALSAVFAVVIGTSTLQHRDATAQTDVSVSLAIVTEDTSGDDTAPSVKEGASGDDLATVTVTVATAPGTGNSVTIPITLGGTAKRKVGTAVSKDNDYSVGTNNAGPSSVTITGDNTTGDLTITIEDDDTSGENANGDAEGTETITVGLGTLPSGYAPHATNATSGTIKVYDEENSDLMGTVTISKTAPAVGDALRPTAMFTSDADGLNTYLAGPDGTQGDNPNTQGDESADDKTPMYFQWGTVATDGTWTNLGGLITINADSTDASGDYTLTADEAGDRIAVRARVADDAGFGGSAGSNYIQSATTAAVLRSVTINVSSDDQVIRESGDDTSATVTVNLNAAPGDGNSVTIPITLGGTAKRKVGTGVGKDHDYIVGANNAGPLSVTITGSATDGSLTISAQDDDTGGIGDAEGTETIMVGLGSLPSGYVAGAATSISATIKIYDEENSKPAGTVNISDTTPTVNDALRPSAMFSSDADGLSAFRAGPDGKVDDDPATTDADETDDNNLPITYQWGTVAADGTWTNLSAFTINANSDDDDADLTVGEAQAGMMIAVRASFTDDAGHTATQDNYVQSATTAAVLRSVTLDVDDAGDVVTEGNSGDSSAIITVSLSAAPGQDANNEDIDVTIPVTLGGTAKRKVGSGVGTDHDYSVGTNNAGTLSVTISGNDSTGTLSITIEDDDTNSSEAEGTAEGTETIAVGLGSLPSGYAPGAPDTNGNSTTTRTIKIYDEENSDPTGTVTISDTTPAIGDALRPSAMFASDADGMTTFLAGPDTIQGDDPATSGDESADDKTPLYYQWGTVAADGTWADVGGVLTISSTSDDDDADLTVADTHAGQKLAVRARFADDAGFGSSTGNYIQSAATAAVLKSVTLSVTTENTTGDNTAPSVTEGVEADDVATVTVTLSAAPGSGNSVDIPITLSGSASASDYTAVPADNTVTIADGNSSGSITITIADDDNAEGTETIKAALGTIPVSTGYGAGAASSATITVHDDDNSATTGQPVIKEYEIVAFVNAQGSLAHKAVTTAVSETSVDMVLVADLGAIMDADGLDTAKSTDEQLGIVDENGEIPASDATTLAPPTNDAGVTYAWGTLNSEGVFSTPGGLAGTVTGNTYAVQSGDLGKSIALRVTIDDDAHASSARTTGNTVTSAGVGVQVLVSFDMATYTAAPGDDVTVDVVLSNAVTGANSTTIPLTVSPATTGIPASVTVATTKDKASFTYSVPSDITGRKTITLSFNASATNWPANHSAGSSATIVIQSATNSPPASGYSLTIDNTSPAVGDTLTATLSGLADPDGLANPLPVTFTWTIGDNTTTKTASATGEPTRSATSTYVVSAADSGKAISVQVSYTDLGGRSNTTSSSAKTAAVGGLVPPTGTAKISRIAPAIRGITASAGDTVRLSVDVYGLQNVKDAKLGSGVTFDWGVTPSGGSLPADAEGNSTVVFTTPSSPGTYTVTASLPSSACYDSSAKAGEEMAGCSASFEVRVRRPAPEQPEAPAPVNPPGEIPSILTDGDGNQYEVFTPEGGGAFAGVGYSLSADAGAVPNNEYIGIRVSDEGAASNAGMTHQRYTLGGNMYAISAVDSSGATISSYQLSSAAEVCLPLPAELRTNISDLAIVTINADDTLTILAASVRLSSADAHVCGNLSALPASVAVGNSGAPAALPTATPMPEPETPDTGGTAPTSNAGLWILLLGTAIATFGTLLVIARRRESARK